MISKGKGLMAALIAIVFVSLAVPAQAAVFVLSTAPGATETGGNPVNASVTVTTGNGVVNISLFNNLVNPTTVAQNVSSLQLTFAGGTNFAGGSISSQSSTLRTINADGTYTDGGVTNLLGWIYSGAVNSFLLNVLAGGGAGPEHTLVGLPDGSNLYSNANPSLKNNPHNPQLFTQASWTIAAAGVTEQTVVTGGVFGFGTESGNNVPGRPPDDQGVPEPATVVLFGAGFLALVAVRKRRALTSN